MPRTPAILSSHWRQLLAVIAPPLALASLLQSLITMFTAGDRGIVFHGELIGPTGLQDVVGALIWLVAWLIAISAGVVVAAGAARDLHVGPAAAVRYALSRLHHTGFVAIQGIIAGLLLLLLLGIAMGVVGWMALVALVFIAVLLARLAVALPSALLQGPGYLSRAHDVTRGRALYPGFIFVLGFVVLPGGASWLTGLLRGLPDSPALAAPIALAALALVVAVVAVQAVTLTVVYLEPRVEGDPHPAADLAAVDATLTGVGGREAGAGLLGLAGLAVAAPALIGLLVAFINPYAAPVLDEASVPTGHVRLAGVGVAPDGRPVAITEQQIFTCEDTDCQSGTHQRDTVGASRSETVLDDGSIVGIDRDSTQAVLTVCAREGSCKQAKFPLPKLGFQWQSAALTVTPHGTLVIVAVVEYESSTDVVLWRCPGLDCSRASQTYIQPYFSLMGNDVEPIIAIGQSPQGFPVVAWGRRDAQLIHMARCDDEACTHVQRDTRTAYPPVTSSVPDAVQEVGGFGIDRQGKLVVAIVSRRPQQGFGIRFSIGEFDRIALVRCDTDDCRRRSARRPWHRLDDYRGERIWVAFTPDNSPVLVHAGDSTGVARVITCVQNCTTGWG
ncbi:hypothetical protein F4553_006258 [Allocatelliglobosispora scoriae]|uniref:Uncharacterized protein n=1 Tax=Allocatelliglobosispora scoriae TaxID=643052 RepID=A0A841BXD7_9ACTN|nr:hypothetical protein [Allocatelliglobosispora scoriae]MBB5872824.1 hypothetical protein [Allocatelliglobosispora scoriae]